MALNLNPYKINLLDKLRTGFRAKYNLLLGKVIQDTVPTEIGFKHVTNDGTELPVDLTEFFYTKENIDEIGFISYATEEEAGKIRIATIEEVLDGSDDLTVVTPYKLSLLLGSQQGRAIIAGEDILSGDMVYLYYPPPPEEPVDPEDEPVFPVLLAKKAIATAGVTFCMGWAEYDALEGEETFIRLSGTVNTYQQDLDVGKYYYLSAEDPGKLVETPPTEPGTYQQIIGYAISEIEIMVEIHRPEMNWDPVFIEFPELYFIVGQDTIQEILLTDYIAPYNLTEEEVDNGDGGITINLISGFSYKFIDLPDWISEHSVVFDNMTLIGNPTEVERVRSILQVIGPDGRIFNQDLFLNAVLPPKISSNLVEVTFPDLTIVGSIPGAYEAPTLADIQTTITGRHAAFRIKITGGGPDGSAITKEFTQPVEVNSLGVYRAFEEEGGVVLPEGLYKYEVTVYANEDLYEIKKDTTYFTIGDEEYLSKLIFELWNPINDTKIGDIAIIGETSFRNPDVHDVKTTITDLLRDKVTIRHSANGELLKETIYEHDPAISTEEEYFVYEEPQEDQPSGDYTIEAIVEHDGDVVYQRLSPYKILDKDPEPEGGIVLVEMIPGTADYRTIQVLPLSGAIVELPENGFNALLDTIEGPFDYIKMEYLRKVTGSFVEYDFTRYTKKESYVEFDEPQTEINLLLFDVLSSLELGGIHTAPSTHRFRFTAKLGGATGEIVVIKQSDVTFRQAVDEEDLSGLRFIHVKGPVTEVLDANMPSTGGVYPIPVYNKFWSVSFIKLPSGLEFDEIVIRLKKGAVVLHSSGATDYIYSYAGPPSTELANDQIAYIYAPLTGQERYLLNPSNVLVSIDEEGEYTVEITVKRFGTTMGVFSSTFNLVSDVDVPEIPEDAGGDCCEPKRWDFVNLTTWTIPHNLDGYPEFTLIIDGDKWEAKIDYENSNKASVTWSRPRTGFAITK